MLSSQNNTKNLAPYILFYQPQLVGVLLVHYKNRKSLIKICHSKLEVVTIFICYTFLLVDKAAPFANYFCKHKCFNLLYCNLLREYSAPDFQLSHVNF